LSSGKGDYPLPIIKWGGGKIPRGERLGGDTDGSREERRKVIKDYKRRKGEEWENNRQAAFLCAYLRTKVLGRRRSNNGL